MCVDRRTTEIAWEKASDFWSCFFGVISDSNTLSLAAYRSPISFITDEYTPLRGALIVREADGGPIVELEGAVFSAAVGGEKALFSTENGLLCFDAATGKQLWNSGDHDYPHRGITIKDERAYVGSDDGKVYSFLLENPFPFAESGDIPDYSELGEIRSIHVDYFLSYCIGGLTKGEVHLVLQDDGMYAVTGYEEQLHMEGEKNFDFERMYSAPVDKSTGIKCDQTIKLCGFYVSQYYPIKMRRIKFYDSETEKTLIFLTNNFELIAMEIAMLYKHRWFI